MAKEDDRELTADEKAELIGDKVGANGVDKNAVKDEEIPDYEVTEEKEGEQTVEEEDDKRLGKTREDREEKGERLTNREKRLLRKKRLAQKFDAKDALIKQQQEQINGLATRLNDVDGKLSQVDYNTLVSQYNEAKANFDAATQAHANAFKNGDGDAATAAMRHMYAAQKRIDEIEAIDARNRQLSGQPQRQQQQAHDPRVVSKATEWGNRNEWFTPGGKDDDSAIADAIAAKLVKEGFDPRADDYWDELDERLAKKGIGSDDDDQQDQSQSQRERQTVTRKERRSPPMGGGGNGRGDLGAGKVSVSLPTKFIEGLKQAGVWENIPRRNKAIAEFQRIRAEGGR